MNVGEDLERNAYSLLWDVQINTAIVGLNLEISQKS